MNPRLIRANIALFQGKRSETRRLLAEHTAEEPDTRRSPMVLWLDAQSQPKHAERMSGLTALIDNAPSDDSYHRMAKNYLTDEKHYADLLDTESKRRPIRPWQIVAALVAIGVVIVMIVLLRQPAPVPVVVAEATATEEATEEVITPTALPTATPIVQNTPQAALVNGSSPRGEYELDGGSITILSVDPAVKVVVDLSGVPLEPVEGATFYGFELQFQCFLPICNEVPQARLFARLDPRIPKVLASEGLFVAGEEALTGRAALGGLVTGWVVFELPRNNPPSGLIIEPFPLEGSEEQPEQVVIDLP